MINKETGEWESREFPKENPIVLDERSGMPKFWDNGIKAKRCQKCNLVFFTNNSDFENCSDCKD